jgi:Flp pilus assembly protein protease CpaA
MGLSAFDLVHWRMIQAQTLSSSLVVALLVLYTVALAIQGAKTSQAYLKMNAGAGIISLCLCLLIHITSSAGSCP